MSLNKVSLVTACMNREAHLRESLSHWLALPCISEIVIVDWSNRTPLRDLVAIDDRIKVIRVDDEPQWILPYAFNVGISLVSNEVIIKSDADSAPRKEIENYEPNASAFFAGDWQRGQPVGKASINGQCVISRTQFERVNGYSELIRTWGREDWDFYDRLILAGYSRREIPPDVFDLIEHSDSERLTNQRRTGDVKSLDDFLEQSLPFLEARNFYIGKTMPWGPWFMRAQYETLESVPRAQVVRRRKDLEIAVPTPVAEEARKFATRSVVTSLLGLPADGSERLDETACRQLILQRLNAARVG
jgi:hypothetical protein